ncbi:SWIM zinc finger family protein [Streptomyces sp. NPDC005481]|uniref:SWIM zinc finger family protein n=1 Tax=Streptomyces sp. NPDC005481 TaxID=3154881 RepID=UPI0033AD038D
MNAATDEPGEDRLTETRTAEDAGGTGTVRDADGGAAGESSADAGRTPVTGTSGESSPGAGAGAGAAGAEDQPPVDRDREDESAEPEGVRPADAARRALRAARERDIRASEAFGDRPDAHPARTTRTPAPVEAAPPRTRPGDAAREALRRAATGNTAAPVAPEAAVTGEDGPTPEPASEPGSPAGRETTPHEAPPGTNETDEADEADETVGTARPADTGETAGTSRPADIAREALRAARGAQDRERKAASRRDIERGRRAAGGAPPGDRERRPARHPSPGNRAQDLRDLLAGAFKLPTDEPQLEEGSGIGERRVPAEEQSSGRAHASTETAEAVPTAGDETRSTSAQADEDADADTGTDTYANANADTYTDAETHADVETHADAGTHADAADAGWRSGWASTPHPRQATASVGDIRAARRGDGDGDNAEPAPARPARRESEAQGTHAGGPGRRSMASPGRDGELRRTFPAFPARSAPASDAFAETWWGNAWVTALEEGALDPARLARGRGYAGRGHVDAITVTPGVVLAYVHGTRARPYRVQVRLRTLTDADWERFLDIAAERPADIAALLDKEMPQSLADCGVALLPGPGDLQPQCSCPDSGHPCKHAAALCYQTARLLDEDPFVLLLLRGRGERELLDELSRRNAARAARAAQDREPAPLPGVRARDALAPRSLPALPAPLPAPPHPEQPPTYPGAPGGPDPFALDQLATDAAARAHALLTAGRDPVGDLTLWQDAVRLAAARPGSGLTAGTRALYSSLATATRRTPAELARAVAAWRQGGIEGLAVLEEPWDPPAGRFDRARPLLLAADLPAFRPWRNHLTHPRGHVQLRLGRDGLWYAYESEPGHDDWWPRGTPDLDPVDALTGLGTPDDL